MKNYLYLLLFLFSVTTFGFTSPDNDKNGVISGQVIDKKLTEPIPYVTVVIKTTSGDVVTGGITNENGEFNIPDIPEGKYQVVIQFIGYKTYEAPFTITKKNNKINLGVIALEEDAQSLDEVVVVADVSTIRQKIDRKVVTVGKDLTTAGSTASDIMNNLPSVSVDQQTGDLSLRGNPNVRVMVDGKLSNVPVAQLLKQIPSSAIKQIELITNPSAKYNPEGMSGIINIILHKNVKIGFNGNVSVGLAYQEQAKYNSNIDMNYRNGKFNFFGSWGTNISKNENFGNVLRTNENTQQLFQFLESSKSNLFKVGFDFYLNEKNTVSFFTNQNIFEGDTNGLTNIFYTDPSLNQDQNTLQANDNTASQYNFDVKHHFNKEGHNLELEVDYNKYTGNQDGDFKFTGASLIPNYMDFVDTKRDRVTANLDYVNPLSETTKLEAGLEARLFETNLDYTSTGLTFNDNGDLVNTPDTKFTYQRDIYSAYATFGKQLEKWSYQVGLRAETVNVKADTSNIRSFQNDYVQVYPSAFVTYSPSEKNQFQTSYSRRIDRPGISQVNPIREWSTPLISSFGNSELKPQFTNSLEINYTRKMKIGNLTAGVFYRIIEDEINRALFIDRTDLNKVILTYDNFDNTTAYGVELSGTIRPTKWWMINGSFDLYSQTQKGISERLDTQNGNPTVNDIFTETITVDNIAWSGRMFNNFKASKKLSLSAFGMYRSKAKGLQFTTKPMYFVNVGARYSLWDGRGTFSLNYNDIFNTMKFGFSGSNPYPSKGEFNWESNTVSVNLSYRFGGSNYRAKSRKNREKDEKSGSGGIF